MLDSTLQVIKAAAKADPSISPTDRAKLLMLVRGGGQHSASATSAPKLLRRREAAERLGVCVRTVDALAKQGVLTKRVFPGRVRAAGFPEADVTALVQGGRS